jgi:hypothetical protein
MKVHMYMFWILINSSNMLVLDSRCSRMGSLIWFTSPLLLFTAYPHCTIPSYQCVDSLGLIADNQISNRRASPSRNRMKQFEIRITKETGCFRSFRFANLDYVP